MKGVNTMKTCIYQRADVKAYLDSIYHDIGVEFNKANDKFGLKHDDLAEAMYIAAECGVGDGNIDTLLSTKQETLLKDAFINGEIGEEYMTRWHTESEMKSLREAKAKKVAGK